jgi:hypothetical protein
MTPKEKAIDLVEKYHIKVKVTFIEHSIPSIVNAQMLFSSAKKCALIAVDEIINETSPLELHPLGTYTNPKIEYWEQVKQEIEKL